MEGINKWDFNEDKTGDELPVYSMGQYKEYLGVTLYAKWVRI